MRIADLRTLVNNDFLKNDIISGAEAKELVDKVVGNNLTSYGVKQFEKLRAEFQDSFSSAGLAAYDKAVEKALAKRGGPPPASNTPGSIIGVQSGLDLDHIEATVKLSEVKDLTVRGALKKLDVNGDSKINSKDMKILGLSEDQMRMFIFSARLMGAKIDASPLTKAEIEGKKICFTAVGDKEKFKDWATELGAKPRSTVSKTLDILVVGNAAITSKDERALAFNELGKANIRVVTDVEFEKAAKAANASGSNPDPLSRQEFQAKVNAYIEAWYEEHITEAYAEELSDASTPAERATIQAKIKDEIENGGDIDASDDSYTIDDRYWSDDPEDNMPFTDRLGEPVPKDAVEEWYISFYPDYAGIGLSMTFFFDNRTGEMLEEGEMQD